MNVRILLLAALLFVIVIPVSAQKFERDSLFILLLESVSRNNENENVTSYINQLNYQYAHPVNLNSAPLGELLGIPFIDFSTALAITEFRQKNGPVLTEQTLADSSLFDQTVIQLCLPFVYTKQEALAVTTVKLPAQPYHLRTQANYQNTFRSAPSYYAGGMTALSTLLHYSDNKGTFAAIHTEKDAGEKSFTDYLSFTLHTPPISVFNALTFGDYTIDFGSGLLYTGSKTTGLGRYAINSVNNAPKGIEPHIGFNEFSYLRGAAVSFFAGPTEVTAFISSRKLDITPVMKIGNGKMAVLESGNHYLAQFEEYRGALRSNSGGVMGTLTTGPVKLGILLSLHSYDSCVAPIKQQTQRGGSIFGSWKASNKIQINTEFAVGNAKPAAFGSVTIGFWNNKKFAFFYRYLSANYFSPEGVNYRSFFSTGAKETTTGMHLISYGKNRVYGLSASYYEMGNTTDYEIKKMDNVSISVFNSTEFSNRLNALISLTFDMTSTDGTVFNEYEHWNRSSLELKFNPAIRINRFISLRQWFKYRVENYVGRSTGSEFFLSLSIDVRPVSWAELIAKFEVISNEWSAVRMPVTDTDDYYTPEYYRFTERMRNSFKLQLYPSNNTYIRLMMVKSNKSSISTANENQQYSFSIRQLF